MKKLYIKTPILFSEKLSRHLGSEVFLKLDNLQPSGSFKNRGIGTLCASLAEQGAKGIVIASGGNAGLAAAYSGRKLGIGVKVVVPETTLLLMKDKIEEEGADYIVHGKTLPESRPYAQELANELGWPLVSPFDHPLIWQGNSTLIDEVVEEGIIPDAVVVAVGGGGLFCGVIEGLDRHGLQDVSLITAETEGIAKLEASMALGHSVNLKTTQTIATSLSLAHLTEQAVRYATSHRVFPQVVSDALAARACYAFCNDHRLIVEPACGAALALIYEKNKVFKNYQRILVEVCGGCVVSPEMILKWNRIKADL